MAKTDLGIHAIPRLTPAGRPVPEAGPESEYDSGKPRLPKGLFVTPRDFWCPEPAVTQPLGDQETFRTFVRNLKNVGARAVYLYPTYDRKAIWPSRHLQSMDRDLLQEFCRAMHEAGLEVHLYYLERDPYFGPVEGYRNQVECLWRFAERWTNVLEEIVSREIDGLCVPPDEYWWPVHIGMPGPDDPCTRKFREWYGFDPPPELANGAQQPVLDDTPAGRAWIEFGYRSMAEIFSGWNETVKRLNPRLVRTNILHIGHIAYNRRDNVDYGLIGHGADWTCLMTDPYVSLHTRLKDRFYVPETVKLLTAGTPGRMAHVTLQNRRLEDYEPTGLRPVDVYGSVASALGNGAKGVYLFHYNRVFDRQTALPVPDHHPHTARAFGLMRTLDRWGIQEARPPRGIALLYSRRSQDYAELRPRSRLGNGYDAHEAACDLLFSGGYPFELYYVEQTESWRDLPEARVLLLPFGYALSDAEVEQLESHVQRGRRLILLQRLGEADGNGRARPAPALSGLMERYPDRIVHVAGDLGFRQADPAYRALLYAALDEKLGDGRRLLLDRRGADAEVTVMELPGNRLLAFAINWESRPVEITLGLRLPSGVYRVTERNRDGVQSARLSGRTRIDAAALGRFSTVLQAEEVKIWRVEPVG